MRTYESTIYCDKILEFDTERYGLHIVPLKACNSIQVFSGRSLEFGERVCAFYKMPKEDTYIVASKTFSSMYFSFNGLETNFQIFSDYAYKSDHRSVAYILPDMHCVAAKMSNSCRYGTCVFSRNEIRNPM